MVKIDRRWHNQPTMFPHTAPHPAKFSDKILTAIGQELPAGKNIKTLDPFGGTSKIKALNRGKIFTNELEPEWAMSGYGADTIGDALRLPYADETFDAICTSPTYGNRMADHHNAQDGSHRVSYTHYIGRSLDKRNSGVMQWNRFYRDFHKKAWLECNRVLKHGGLFMLNISDHIRKGEIAPVSGWHLGTVLVMGYSLVRVHRIYTDRMKYGANSDLRVGYENLYIMRKENKTPLET